MREVAVVRVDSLEKALRGADMSLSLMYITNNPTVALIAEKNGVDRIWVDLETLGKEERQKNMNSVKSHHTVQDVANISKLLTTAELQVRINPWHEGSKVEIEQVIAAGANRIMLPMWKSLQEVDEFLHVVNKRVATTLLLETREAEECLDHVLKHPLLDEIHIGLNDLHLSYGLTFMFELLSNGTVERMCDKMKQAGVNYGFGGIARIGEGTIPAEMIVMEHYRLGSTRAILARSFCNTTDGADAAKVEELFAENMKKLRDWESEVENSKLDTILENTKRLSQRVSEVVDEIKWRNENV